MIHAAKTPQARPPAIPRPLPMVTAKLRSAKAPRPLHRPTKVRPKSPKPKQQQNQIENTVITIAIIKRSAHRETVFLMSIRVPRHVEPSAELRLDSLKVTIQILASILLPRRLEGCKDTKIFALLPSRLVDLAVFYVSSAPPCFSVAPKFVLGYGGFNDFSRH